MKWIAQMFSCRLIKLKYIEIYDLGSRLLGGIVIAGAAAGTAAYQLSAKHW